MQTLFYLWISFVFPLMGSYDTKLHLREECHSVREELPQLFDEKYKALVRTVGSIKKSTIERWMRRHPILTENALISSNLRDIDRQLQLDLNLTASQIASIRKRSLKWTYRGNVRAICLYFKSIGMEKKDIALIIMKAPQIFQYSFSNIKSTIEFFQFHNFAYQDIIYMITSRPLVLSHAVDGKLSGTIKFLKNDLSMNETSWKRVIVRYPQVFNCKLENLTPRANFLEKECCLNNKLDVAWMVAAFPPVLWLSEKNISMKLGYLRQQFSFEPIELRDILVTYPQVLGLSLEKNLTPKIKYFLDFDDGGGLTVQELKDFVLYQPALLAYSLSTRIKPRVQRMKDNSIKLAYSPPSVMSLTDSKFDAWLQTQISTWSIT